MQSWPTTRLTLLGRLADPQDKEAWNEFVALYGPFIFSFARRRLPQDEDAADVMQEVLSAVLKGTYERPKGRFQKWLLTILLNEIRDFHTARARRSEVLGEYNAELRLEEESERVAEEWELERRRHLFHAAAKRVRERVHPTHWDVFVQTALQGKTGQEAAGLLDLTVTNVYAVKSRILKDIKEEIDRLEEDL
jgi:RNA polymerase sigma factor (sigma-70 family)